MSDRRAWRRFSSSVAASAGDISKFSIAQVFDTLLVCDFALFDDESVKLCEAHGCRDCSSGLSILSGQLSIRLQHLRYGIDRYIVALLVFELQTLHR